MCLMWFRYKVVYVPGKLLGVADTLFCVPAFCIKTTENNLCLKVENHFDQVVAYLPASSDII